ncbi:MAG: histidine--tRNA ligase [Rickettsiaceae bacterium]
MSGNLAPLRGMKDLLPDEYRVHQHIISTAANIAQLYGYQGFSTPILESASVFDRTLGDTSDVISKEMYSFHDKKGRLVALRPEFTASIMRAVISNGLKQKLPLKLFSCGPLFRYDRPQEGRQRQFHQLNFEYIGAKGPYSDAETIALAAHVLEELEILEDVTLELNSLGCVESRQAYQASLVEYFKQNLNELSEDSKKRLEQNPLRILDSKDEADKKISSCAPLITDFYTSSAADYFEQVKENLDNLNVKYILNPKLARGLDYYSHTTFEFTTSKLGAQSTILAGGRYDGLSTLMGEAELPALGFAAGIERIALMKKYTPSRVRPVYILPIGSECFTYSIALTNTLRRAKIATTIELDGKIGKRMQSALADNASHVIFIGLNEMENNSCKLKDLDSNNEIAVDINQLSTILTS